MKVPSNLREATYSASLAQESGWCDVVTALEAVLIEREVLHDDIDRTVYIAFEFMDGKPCSMGIYSDPSVIIRNHPHRGNSNIYEVLEDALCPTLVMNPMHHALFRYKDRSWQAVRVFDSYKETWNQWRASRTQFNSDRLEWFKQLANDKFEFIHTISLYIMIDQETTEQEIVPLLIGVDSEVVWMMTSRFSDRLNPYSGNNWVELPSCNAEILYRCTRAQLGERANLVEGLTNSLEVAAITQVAEAFYWRYVDGLDKRTENPDVDFSKPQRLQTLSEHTGSSQALKPNTPFLLNRYTKNGHVMLSDNRKVTPALVTIEGAVSSKLNPSVSSIVKSATGSLGQAPTVFAGPSDVDLFTLLRDEIAGYGSIQSTRLKKRMQSLAGLEFHYGRYLPEDLAPHLDYLYFVELGYESWSFHKRQVQQYAEFDLHRHDEPVYDRPSLTSLSVYTGLKTLDLRSCTLDDLNWLETVEGLEELLLGDTNVEDFSPLANATELRYLDLAQTNLKSLAPLLSLTKLDKLNLYSVQIEDISPLSTMKTLKKLTLSHMPICDISCFASLPNLEEVLLAGIDNIKDYSVLSSLPNLKLLSVAETAIKNLSVLPDMPKLETLYLWDCVNVTDLSPLERYGNLKPVNTKGTGVVQS